MLSSLAVPVFSATATQHLPTMDPSPNSDRFQAFSVPGDGHFTIPVNCLEENILELREEGTSNTHWSWRKGSGAALVSSFSDSDIMPPQFVPRVIRGSEPCFVNRKTRRSSMYKTIACSHRYNTQEGYEGCKAEVKLLFSLSDAEDVIVGGKRYRKMYLQWVKEKGSSRAVPCFHERGAVGRGITRKSDRARLAETSRTPAGMTLAALNKKTAVRVKTGIRTGVPIVAGTAHKASYIQVRQSYEPTGDLTRDIQLIQALSTALHASEDPKMTQGFFGSVHDIEISDEGQLSALAFFSPSSQKIHHNYFLSRTTNSNFLLMDSTMMRDRPLKVSLNSSFVKRAQRRGSKLKYTKD